MLWVVLLCFAVTEAQKQKGVNFLNGQWSPPKFDSEQAHQSFDLLAPSGSDYLALTFCWYQWNIYSTSIYPRQGTSPTEEQITSIVTLAHSKGSKVMIRPLVDPDWTNPHVAGTWRGMIGQNFTDVQWTAWFKSYSAFILQFARLAESLHADEFSVGGELIMASHQEKYWRELVTQVKQVFHGPILYGANHGNENAIHWWDAVDFIAIDAYYPLDPGNSNPSVADLKQAWSGIATNLHNLSTRFGKKVIFSEIGYCSISGANTNPAGCSGRNLDLNAQANLYEATYEVFWPQDWFGGIFWWAWTTNPQDGGPNDKGFSPLNKPAEKVMAKWNK